MKKTVVVEILLLLAFCVLLACAINYLRTACETLKTIEWIKTDPIFSDPEREDLVYTYNLHLATTLSYGIPALIAALSTLAAMVIIAIKDFPVFKPLVDKFNAKRAAHNEQRAAVKAEQAEEAKQARIEQLQAELDELKKDE